VYLWARRGKIEWAWISTVLEVLGHAVLAVSVIGWDSGFHYYILLVIPVAVFSSVRPMALRGVIVLVAMVSYLAMDIILRHRVPPYVLPGSAMDGLHYFNVLGVMVILLFLASYYYHLINNAEATLRAMASTDPLTQLLNRRAMGEAVQREHSRTNRGDHPLSFMLCDLDHFKAINDRYGHEAGDAVLRAVSGVLAQGVRECDYLARWGGEEFLAALPDTDMAHARMAAERLRAAVEALDIDYQGEHPSIQVTIGVSTMQAGESPAQAISRADDALYEGKRVGRNRVVVASP
jgi:diguanylate cyclase (GGDEF)-like protein